MMDFWENRLFWCIANSGLEAARYCGAMGATLQNLAYIETRWQLFSIKHGAPLFLCGDVEQRLNWLGAKDVVEQGHANGDFQVVRLEEDKLFPRMPQPTEQMSRQDYDKWYGKQRLEYRRAQHSYIVSVLEDWL